jgi:hypothetical protein
LLLAQKSHEEVVLPNSLTMHYAIEHKHKHTNINIYTYIHISE